MVSIAERRRLGGRLHAFTQVFDPPLGTGGGPTFAIKDLIDVAGAPTGGGGVVPPPVPHADSAMAPAAASARICFFIETLLRFTKFVSRNNIYSYRTRSCANRKSPVRIRYLLVAQSRNVFGRLPA